jgi:hypothetical protein
MDGLGVKVVGDAVKQNMGLQHRCGRPMQAN